MQTPRQRMVTALERKSPSPGRVPHFELVFFLTMEAFGKVHPSHRHYEQWRQMEEKERQLHRRDMADLYIAVAERYGHNAIFLHPNPDSVEETLYLVDLIREKTGDRFFILRHGDGTFAIPDGAQIAEFAYQMADEPQMLKDEASRMVEAQIRKAEAYQRYNQKQGLGLDGFALCADYCFNTGPFLSPGMFGEFITPFLTRLIQAYREMGFYTIKHTDGNILPIVDQLVQANPHALHSLDPQAGIDMAQIKRSYGDQVCLIGNVNCGLLDTGSDEEVIASARYALQHGMPGGGYIFSTSNCIYPGMRLERYELMLNVWRKEGNYL